MESQNIYQKLHEARKYIKTCDMEKKGENKFSQYKYFTPEQVSELVFQACEKNNLIPLFSLKKNEFGYYGEVVLVCTDGVNKLTFEMSTDIPNIKATNITQQIGGAVTYTERYLLMSIFDIKDNNLDFDSQDNTQQPVAQTTQEKEWLNKWTSKDKTDVLESYRKVVNRAKEKGMTVQDLRQHYKINKEIAKELETDLDVIDVAPNQVEDPF
jgi:hypothetical protein